MNHTQTKPYAFTFLLIVLLFPFSLFAQYDDSPSDRQASITNYSNSSNFYITPLTAKTPSFEAVRLKESHTSSPEVIKREIHMPIRNYQLIPSIGFESKSFYFPNKSRLQLKDFYSIPIIISIPFPLVLPDLPPLELPGRN